jgi:2-methylisocitrate lyase-like PEP mutase family enzyme
MTDTTVSSLFRAIDPTKARKRLGSKLQDPTAWPVITPLVHDVMSARLAEQAGFDTVVISGYAVSATRLGLPDAGFLGLAEMSDVARNVSARTALSVVVDCDTGYGNAITAMRTTEEMITVGASAIFIEDQVAPKRCGMVAGKVVVPAEEFAGKLAAVDRVRRELAPDLTVIARCDARGVAGGTIEDVIRRGHMYREAGADVFFPEALNSAEDLERCAREVGGPLLYNMGGHAPHLSAERLRELKVGIVFVGNSFAPALAAIRDNFRQLKADLSHWQKATAAAGINAHELVRFPEVMRMEDEFLPSETQLARYEGSIGFKPGDLRAAKETVR